MLLSDPETARLINEKFVPCWETVRPVPKVTIDFGDGRTLQRTLAGNTVISLCLPDGRPVDAFPGVYTPADFRAEVTPTLDLLASLDWKSAPADRIADTVLNWHRERFVRGVQMEGTRTTHSKAFVESPLLRALGLSGFNAISYGKSKPTQEAEAGRAAEEVNAAPKQDEPLAQSVLVARLRATVPVPLPPARLDAGTPRTPDPLQDPKGAFAAISAGLEDVSKRAASLQQVRRIVSGEAARQPKTPEQLGREVVAADSRTNVRTIRPAVHLWFMAQPGLPQQQALRDSLYKDLLHVPVDDPYLGLTGALVPGTPNQ